MRPEAVITSLLLHLMANGWSFNKSTQMFTKGAGRVAFESLSDLRDWPGVIGPWRKAIEKGLIGWSIHTRQRPNGSGFRVDIDWTWPDAVTRLGEIAHDDCGGANRDDRALPTPT